MPATVTITVYESQLVYIGAKREHVATKNHASSPEVLLIIVNYFTPKHLQLNLLHLHLLGQKNQIQTVLAVDERAATSLAKM